MLCENRIGDELPAIVHAPVRNDPLPLAKQVRQYAAVNHRQLVHRIRQHELHVEFAILPLEAVLDDETADPEVSILRHVACLNLGYLEVKHHIVLESSKR